MKTREVIEYAALDSRFGQVLVAQSAKGVCAVIMGDGAETVLEHLISRYPDAAIREGKPALHKLTGKIVAHIEEPGTKLEAKLDIRGTAFQKRVWAAVCKIPPGKTLSYADVARKIGMPRAGRAVAGACGASPLAVLIPCHRVVKSDGSLTGGQAGVARRRRLLIAEGWRE